MRRKTASTKHTNNMTLGWACFGYNMDAAMRATLARETRRQRQAAITILVSSAGGTIFLTLLRPPYSIGVIFCFFPFDPQEKAHNTATQGAASIRRLCGLDVAAILNCQTDRYLASRPVR